MPTDAETPAPPPREPAAVEDLWRLVWGLRYKNGRLQQRWVRCRDGLYEWRDVPEVWGDDV